MRPVGSLAWSVIALATLAAVPAYSQVSPAETKAAKLTLEEEADAEKRAELATQSEARRITQEVLNTTAPAFAALGVSGQTITEPEGLKTAALGLINGTDADGKPLTGLGVQFAPAQLIPALWIDYSDYSANPKRLFHGPRAFARLQITAAYARADSSDAGKPERASFGAVWVPFDTTDPFVNAELKTCLAAANIRRLQELKIAPRPFPSGGTGQSQRDDPELARAQGGCRVKFSRTPTNGYSSQIGIAKLFRSRDGGKGPLVGAGFAASAVVSIGLDCLFKNPCRTATDSDPAAETKSHIGGKLVLGAVIRERELIANPLDDKKFIDRNRQSYGGRLIVGNASRWWLGVEFLRQHASYSGLGTDNYITYNASLDIKVGKGLWLAANYGDSSGENFGKSSQFTAGLKFALQPSSSIGGSE